MGRFGVLNPLRCAVQCAAAKAGIQKYVDEVAFAWPWKPAARTSMSSTASSEVRLALVLQCAGFG